MSAKLETYPNSKESRGLAYIQFEDVAHAEAAIEALNGKDFKGKQLEIFKLNKKDKKKADNPVEPKVAPKKNNLFVKNLPALSATRFRRPSPRRRHGGNRRDCRVSRGLSNDATSSPCGCETRAAGLPEDGPLTAWV